MRLDASHQFDSSPFSCCLFFAGGLTGAIVLVVVIAVLGMSESSARSAGDSSGPTVNRTLKGDRMPKMPASYPNAVSQVALHPVSTAAKMPDGCESLVSPLANLQAVLIARRCVS